VERIRLLQAEGVMDDPKEFEELKSKIIQCAMGYCMGTKNFDEFSEIIIESFRAVEALRKAEE